MKTIMLFAAGLVAVGLAAGCSSTKTTTFDPTDPGANTARALGTVSQAECFMAARAAAENAMASPSFDRFLAQYRREKGDTLAVPLMQVGHLQNKTDDPNLQMGLVTDELCTALLNSGKVEVTLGDLFRGARPAQGRQLQPEHRRQKRTAGSAPAQSRRRHPLEPRRHRRRKGAGLLLQSEAGRHRHRQSDLDL